MGRTDTGRILRFFTAALLAAAAPAWADVTLTQTTSGKMFGPDASGTSVTRIKGHKMRIDTTRAGADDTSMIFDVDGGKMIIVNNTKKEATIRNMADVGAALTKISDADMQAKLDPTSATKQVAGASCTVYDSNVSVKFSMVEKQPPIEMVMTGPVCLSKTAPGHADFSQFYANAAEKGFIFTDPQVAKAQPGMAKGMAKMMKTWADAGLPLSSDVAMSFKGEGMFAQMMNKMGSGKMVSETTKIDTGTLSDDLFAVPAGYKTKN
jgi:hypothetical protein